MNDVRGVPVLLPLAGDMSQVIGDGQGADHQRQEATDRGRTLEHGTHLRAAVHLFLPRDASGGGSELTVETS